MKKKTAKQRLRILSFHLENDARQLHTVQKVPVPLWQQILDESSVPVPGLEKTRLKKKKPSPVGFFGFFWFFWVFLGSFAQTRGFLGFFSVSRILLGASRL